MLSVPMALHNVWNCLLSLTARALNQCHALPFEAALAPGILCTPSTPTPRPRSPTGLHNGIPTSTFTNCPTRWLFRAGGAMKTPPGFGLGFEESHYAFYRHKHYQGSHHA
ncbi:hypothetical protein C8Q77DRAFT_1149444 [Trametes polyzona]|nr:hypothetical protein C8Q77DRAFT_1149444 [Trametes polyzona]